MSNFATWLTAGTKNLRPGHVSLLVAWLLISFCPWASRGEAAEVQPAKKLFPQSTVVWFHVPDSRQMGSRFWDSAIGRMLQDPQMKPLAEQVYAAVVEAARPATERVGLSLTELTTLAQGEVAIGLVAAPEREPALLAIIETGDATRVVDTLLDQGAKTLIERGATQQSEKAGDVELMLYQLAGPRQRQLGYFQRDGRLVLASQVDLLKEVAGAWEKGFELSLADNPQFAAITKNVSPGGDESPQFDWFVDPINLAKGVGQQNANVQIGLALLPALGLDGVLGMGGSWTLASQQFDSIVRIHVLLDNPRAGVVELIALRTGDTGPEAWVPAQVASYATFHWDVQTTYTKLAKLVDSFQGEGAFKRQVEQRVLDQIKLDLEKDLLPLVEGRITYVTLIEEPINLRSQSPLIGIRLKDTDRARDIFDQLGKEYEAFLVRKQYGNVGYYKYAPPQLGEEPAEDENPERRPPRPAFCLLGDYLLIGRDTLLEKAISANSDPTSGLAGQLDYKLIASKIARQPGGDRPSMLSFHRPDEGLRMVYGLATSDRTRESLQRQAESNPFFKNLNQAMQDHPLPPFEVLRRYVAPGGVLLVDDETGWHYTSFVLRRDKD